MEPNITLVEVHATQLEALKKYIAELYEQDKEYEALVNIEEGVNSLMRNPALATAYFIKREGTERIGYVILTRYHSVEKGGVTIYIDELFVEKPFRRQGVGKTILKSIQAIADHEGARTLWAQTESHNEVAQNFFSSQGFRFSPSRSFERGC